MKFDVVIGPWYVDINFEKIVRDIPYLGYTLFVHQGGTYGRFLYYPSEIFEVHAFNAQLDTAKITIHMRR